MKRKNQRLSLSRETLKMLEAPLLDAIAGGKPSLIEGTCRAASCLGGPCSGNDICSSICP
ncbi:MAG TPA: hypothetical protein VGS22_13640 [Thermoanaerobaculia bacterium]|jgi:hypothetical protein|nr:hypothetical protein [Thermoanaerobaculia bacterium]